MAAPDDRWHAALDAVGAAAEGRDEIFAELAARHEAPPRRYHTFAHASAVVDGILSIHSHGDDWAPAVLAGWYHDAVYDPAAAVGVNEGASAVLAAAALTRVAVANSAIGEVLRLICLTADHAVRSGDRTGALLCDADLAVLAGEADDYDDYVRAVRAEYGHVDDAAWQVGRRRALRSFLDRPAIFSTLTGRERWEARARINISSELARLA